MAAIYRYFFPSPSNHQLPADIFNECDALTQQRLLTVERALDSGRAPAELLQNIKNLFQSIIISSSQDRQEFLDKIGGYIQKIEVLNKKVGLLEDEKLDKNEAIGRAAEKTANFYSTTRDVSWVSLFTLAPATVFTGPIVGIAWAATTVYVALTSSDRVKKAEKQMKEVGYSYGSEGKIWVKETRYRDIIARMESDCLNKEQAKKRIETDRSIMKKCEEEVELHISNAKDESDFLSDLDLYNFLCDNKTVVKSFTNAYGSAVGMNSKLSTLAAEVYNSTITDVKSRLKYKFKEPMKDCTGEGAPPPLPL